MVDENLRPFATERQWEILEAYAEHGSERKAAKALGIHRKSIGVARKAVRDKAARQGYSPDHDMTRAVPDGFHLKGTSTYYGEDGQVKAQWVKSNIDRERQQEILQAAILAFVDDLNLPRAQAQSPPKVDQSGLLTGYPIGDHHIGMYTWKGEGGSKYDLEIAEKLLTGAMVYLVNAAPASEKALVVSLGDLLHYDGFVPMTPKNRNPLDAAGRFPEMVGVAIRSMRFLVSLCLRKHKNVHLIFETGNHDPVSAIWMMELFAAHYENEPRVTVDMSPSHFHYYRFGKVLIGTHHGHGVKMDRLPLIMATDRAKDWGETTHRYVWVGHWHNDMVKDINGCRVESFRVLPPKDAWTNNQGYRPGRSMQSIVFHKNLGEVARNTVSAEMLGDGDESGV